MSIAEQVERLQKVRNQIRTKMVSLGLSGNEDLLQKLADDLDRVNKTTPVNNGGTDPGSSYPNSFTITPALGTQYVKVDRGYQENSKVTINPIPNQNSSNSVTVSSETSMDGATIDVSHAPDGLTVTANSTARVSVAMGYYSESVAKGATSSKSVRITPKLAHNTSIGAYNGQVILTAGTSSFTKTSSADYDNGYILAVTVNPTPSQSKSVTPAVASQTVTPDEGHLLSSVTVNATPTQAKTATPKKSDQTITPDANKFLSQVTVKAIPSAEFTLATSAWQAISSPDETGKYTATVSVSGVTASNDVVVMATSNNAEVGSKGVYASSQAAGSLTFKAFGLPSGNISYKVYFLN